MFPDLRAFLHELRRGRDLVEVTAPVDAHLEGCPRCVAFVQSYFETPRVLRRVTDAAMPAGVGASLRRALFGRPR